MKESYYDTPDQQEFELVPEGRHLVKVIKSYIADSKAGNPTWYMTLNVIGTTSNLFVTYGMADKAKSFRKGALTAMGFDTSSKIEYDIEEDVIDKLCIAEVYHDKYPPDKTIDGAVIDMGGTVRAKVKALRSPEKKELAKASKEELRLHTEISPRLREESAKTFEEEVLNDDDLPNFN